MAYTKNNFQDGQILKAAELNKMDDQIAANEETSANALTTANNANEGYKNTSACFESMLTSGVFVTIDADALKPTAIGEMKIQTQPGTVLIKGYGKKSAKSTRTFSVKDTKRTEVYLYRLDTSTGEIETLFRDVILHGDNVIFSKEDGTELPIRSGSIYDVLIYMVTIPAGATEITQDMIEDLRAIEDYCGFVKLHRSLAVEEWEPAEGGTY